MVFNHRVCELVIVDISGAVKLAELASRKVCQIALRLLRKIRTAVNLYLDINTIVGNVHPSESCFNPFLYIQRCSPTVGLIWRSNLVFSMVQVQQRWQRFDAIHQWWLSAEFELVVFGFGECPIDIVERKCRDDDMQIEDTRSKTFPYPRARGSFSSIPKIGFTEQDLSLPICEQSRGAFWQFHRNRFLSGEYIYVPLLRTHMTIGGTTVGPLEPQVRDRLAEYRDREGHSTYNEALQALLERSQHATAGNTLTGG